MPQLVILISVAIASSISQSKYNLVNKHLFKNIFLEFCLTS